MKRSINHW